MMFIFVLSPLAGGFILAHFRVIISCLLKTFIMIYIDEWNFYFIKLFAKKSVIFKNVFPLKGYFRAFREDLGVWYYAIFK